jgi:hypothetical protein
MRRKLWGGLRFGRCSEGCSKRPCSKGRSGRGCVRLHVSYFIFTPFIVSPTRRAQTRWVGSPP